MTQPATSSARLLTALVAASAVSVALSPAAGADPSVVDPGQLPGLTAMQSLSPVVQQAAVNPASAQQLLLAAASQLAGNATTPAGSAALADAVTKFVQQGGAADPAAALTATGSPQALSGTAHGTTPLLTPGTGNGPLPLEAHLPVAGVASGEVHLPNGVNPTHAVGPTPEVLAQITAQQAAAAPSVPAVPAAPAASAAPAAAPVVPAAVTFTGPAPVPAAAPSFDPNTPPTQDFMYPSISSGCLKDGGNVIATALSVAGPAKIPAPGPGPGQTAYVFTAVGTPAPAAEQRLPLNVTWVNLSTGRSGTATLRPNPDINPQGPTTLTAIVDTGSGSVMSTIFGQVTTLDKQCTFMPTIGSTVVP